MCWQHKQIRNLVGWITDGRIRKPDCDGTGFDFSLALIWDDDGWLLQEVPRILLPGDLPSTVSDPAEDKG